MISNGAYKEAFVWVWLPGRTEPVVAGRLAAAGDYFVFNYGQSYLGRKDAIPLYEPELPLRAGVLPLLNGLWMPGCIRDAAPDAWGRRVIINRQLGVRGKEINVAELDELAYLLESGSDRAGALDFQLAADKYVPREASNAALDELLNAVKLVEEGIPLTPDLDRALFHASSIGGARPKALIVDNGRKYIAKFSSQTDVYNVVKAEYVAMRLAAEAGIKTASVILKRTGGRDVLLVERFDRERIDGSWRRRGMVSALTLLELDEMMARYASYEDLAVVVRHRFDEPKATLRQLFARLVFNVLCGNTDDHARNHAAYWDGRHLKLTPAYDICPQARAGGEASQAMLIFGDERLSRLDVCLRAASAFFLSVEEAIRITEHQLKTILRRWDSICEEAALAATDRNVLWRRAFLNPFAFEGAPSSLAKLIG